MAVKIMRGDSYYIPVEIVQDGTPVTPDMVDEIEISVGSSLQKYYSDGSVVYDNGAWYFRLSQEETFALEDSCNVYVRVAYPGGPKDVVGTRAGALVASETGSEEVL